MSSSSSRPLALETDGLPNAEALRRLDEEAWGRWIADRARGRDPWTGLSPAPGESDLSLVERALAKATDIATEERHFYGAVRAVEALWREAGPALGDASVAAHLLARVDDVLWHLARTARPEHGRTLAGQHLERVIVDELLAQPRAPRIGALQALSTLFLPDDASFWRALLDRPDETVLALETLLERRSTDLAGALVQAVRSLGRDSWRLRAVVTNLLQKRPRDEVERIVRDADAQLLGDVRSFLREALRGTAVEPPETEVAGGGPPVRKEFVHRAAAIISGSAAVPRGNGRSAQRWH